VPPYYKGVDDVDVIFFEVIYSVYNESIGNFRSVGKS
jgi:hypothetical protein